MHFFLIILLSFSLSLANLDTAFAAPGRDGSENLPRSDELQPPANRDREPRRERSEPIQPPRATTPAPSDDGDTFILRSITIEGSTIYKTKDIYPVFRFFLGKPTTIKKLNVILERINSFYRQNDWLAVTATLPQQRIGDGVVRIRIFEGSIANIVISGKGGFAESAVLKELKKLKTGKPARTSEVEAAFARLRRFSSVIVKPSLRPSKNVVGGIDLVVALSAGKFYSGNFSASNSANEQLGVWTSSLSGNVNFANANVAVFLSTGLIKPKASFVGRLTYEYSVDYQGSAFGSYLSGSSSLLEGAQALDDKSVGVGLYYKHASYRSPSFTLDLSATYDWSQRLTLDGGGAVSTQGDTHILGFAVSGGYRSPWASYTSFGLGIKQGLTEGGGPDGGNTRFNAGVEQFSRRARWLEANLTHTQPLQAQSGYKPGLTLNISAQGQYAFNPLPNSETIAFGRNSIGRGFTNGRISTDNGYGIATELRASWGPLVGLKQGGALIQEITLFGFVDYARTFIGGSKQRRDDRDEQPSRKLLSSGLGARLRWVNQFYLDVHWARALNNPYQKRFGEGLVATPLPGGGSSTMFGDQGIDLNDKGSDEFIAHLYYLF